MYTDNPNEIINSTVGKNDDGTAKSSILLSLSSHNYRTGEEKEMSSVASCFAEIGFKKLGDYIVVDLIYANDFATDLRRLWAVMENYGNLRTNDCENKYYLSLTIVPVEFEGTRYIAGLSPIFWTLQPQRPGDTINTIRILFEENHFGIYKNDDVDIEGIRESVEKEIEAEENQFEQTEIRKAEEEAYRIEREQKLEEMRKRHYGDD